MDHPGPRYLRKTKWGCGLVWHTMLKHFCKENQLKYPMHQPTFFILLTSVIYMVTYSSLNYELVNRYYLTMGRSSKAEKVSMVTKDPTLRSGSRTPCLKGFPVAVNKTVMQCYIPLKNNIENQ